MLRFDQAMEAGRSLVFKDNLAAQLVFAGEPRNWMVEIASPCRYLAS